MPEFCWTHRERVRFGDCDPMIDLEHEIRADGRLAAEAKSVLVGYDYGTSTSVPISIDLRRKLAA